MKATYAALYYGRGAYPVHESNLPDVEIDAAIAKVVEAMGKLAGGFPLDPPTFINLEIIGNGYTVRVEHVDEGELREEPDPEDLPNMPPGNYSAGGWRSAHPRDREFGDLPGEEFYR